MSKGWIHVEGQVWNKNTCETRRCNHQIVPGNRDADYILRDIEFAVRTVDEKLKKEGTSDPEIEISFSKDDLENCLDAVKKQGQQEAWDLARRIAALGKDCYTGSDFDSVFGSCNATSIFETPVDEALAKDKKYQEEKKALHVGDEVEFGAKAIASKKYRGFITDFVPPNTVRVLTKELGTIRVEPEDCKKTGKHSDEIEKVMASFEEEDDE